LAAQLGILPQEAGAPPASLPEPLYSQFIASITKYHFPEVAYLELLTYRDSEAMLAKAIQVAGVRPLGNLPLVDLVAVNDGMTSKTKEAWIEARKSDDNLLANRPRQLVVKSDHYVPLSSPQSILDAVRQCLEMIAERHPAQVSV